MILLNTLMPSSLLLQYFRFTLSESNDENLTIGRFLSVLSPLISCNGKKSSESVVVNVEVIIHVRICAKYW